MSIEKLYNKVAKTYNQDLSGYVLDKAKQKALQLALQQGHSFDSILALGMGDGSDLLHYVEHYPNAELSGLDISENMLEKARLLLNCKTYHSDIKQASEILDKQRFDFIIAHFVTAYVPLVSVLAECNKLTSKNGLISIVTNTMDSFPVAQSSITKLEASPNPFNKLVLHHIHKTLKTVYVPRDVADLKKTLKDSGFNLLALEELKIDIHFDTVKEVYDFLICGGWFVSGVSHPFLPYKLICKICNQLIHKNLPIPYDDQMTIVVAIAEKVTS